MPLADTQGLSRQMFKRLAGSLGCGMTSGTTPQPSTSIARAHSAGSIGCQSGASQTRTNVQVALDEAKLHSALVTYGKAMPHASVEHLGQLLGGLGAGGRPPGAAAEWCRPWSYTTGSLMHARQLPAEEREP